MSIDSKPLRESLKCWTVYLHTEQQQCNLQQSILFSTPINVQRSVNVLLVTYIKHSLKFYRCNKRFLRILIAPLNLFQFIFLQDLVHLPSECLVLCASIYLLSKRFTVILEIYVVSKNFCENFI